MTVPTPAFNRTRLEGVEFRPEPFVLRVVAALRKSDTVLVKGSLGSKMAVVIDALKAWGK